MAWDMQWRFFANFKTLIYTVEAVIFIENFNFGYFLGQYKSTKLKPRIFNQSIINEYKDITIWRN